MDTDTDMGSFNMSDNFGTCYMTSCATVRSAIPEPKLKDDYVTLGANACAFCYLRTRHDMLTELYKALSKDKEYTSEVRKLADRVKWYDHGRHNPY